MSKYRLFQDKKKCIGCLGCEVSCKTAKDVPVGPRLSRVIAKPPKRGRPAHAMTFVFRPCFHCDEPRCVPACPTGAMRQRPDDGIVYMDASLCDGCKSCITACPWGSPQWDPNTGKVVKCDYCMDRIDQGLKPACVTKCVTHCLHFGKTEEMEDIRRSRSAKDPGR